MQDGRLGKISPRGWVSGTKESWGSPNGITSVSQKGGSPCHCLGRHQLTPRRVWLPHRTLPAGRRPGPHGQRLALQWVQENIAEFGGDPDDVMAMGQSPGAGLIMYLLAHEGKRRCSVQKGHRTVDPIKYLDYPCAARARASDVSIHSQRPSLEKPDSFHRSIRRQRIQFFNCCLLTPATRVLFFTNPRTIGNETALAERLREISPLIPERDVCYVPDTLRSPVYDGSRPYTTDLDCEMLMANEMYFATTHQNLLQSMIRRDTEVLPAPHGTDTPVYWYDGTASSVHPLVENIMQHAIGGFVKIGVSAAGSLGLTSFLRYGKEAKTVDLNVSSLGCCLGSYGMTRPCGWYMPLGSDRL
ncbi:hypothetical protein CCMA1212_006526 [Trichoderma ghanense]|uniref:Carboxylesterase type B domain-containing protein n=1 Tax=Trichoderma ghanense TaxID=65468 RepID=A0ABY2H129_9HYPO